MELRRLAPLPTLPLILTEKEAVLTEDESSCGRSLGVSGTRSHIDAKTSAGKAWKN